MPQCERCGKDAPIVASSPYTDEIVCRACLEEQQKNPAARRPADRKEYYTAIAAGPGKDGINFHR